MICYPLCHLQLSEMETPFQVHQPKTQLSFQFSPEGYRIFLEEADHQNFVSLPQPLWRGYISGKCS